MPDVNHLANAEFIGLYVQLFMTGAYVAYVPRCAVILWRDWRQRSLAGWLPFACLLMFVLTLTDQIITLIRAYEAFSVHENRVRDPVGFYADPRTPCSITKDTINISLTLISDALIVYRTYVIWDRTLLFAVVPSCVLIGNSVLGVFALIALAEGRMDSNAMLSTTLIRYYFVCTFGLNIACASLITWKIWRVGVEVANASAEGWNRSYLMQGVLEVIIQSAGLYCAHLLALILSWDSSAFFIIVDTLPCMTAIVFSTLIVRARSARANMSLTLTT
ncbi:hypothetical protein C8Q80DRAFT_236686 [Daedaleopsis nitida]|nr:hypothetical protein C8Q80DRAFT_236686 [Daedaleopsis nitida]